MIHPVGDVDTLASHINQLNEDRQLSRPSSCLVAENDW